ncbi:MAG TPA: PQQ-dependent sugar dehydrogenase [Terrimicrobiaceae bacterium]|nr:PQQ-dependent sugar dehydrogenase [Terrimicrobiaceae bacterium]
MPRLLRNLSALILTASACAAGAASPSHAFRVETLAEGLKNPWSVAKLPDGRYLVTEREGRLRIIANGRLLPEPVGGVPAVWANGQGGLLDVVLHPDHAANGWIYLSFAKPLPGRALTAIVRGRLRGNELVDVETIFDPPPAEAGTGGAHFGSRIVFDRKGHLFFTIGDRGDVTTPANQAQRLDNVKGKTLRINDDGSIPPDNPFVGRPGARPEIWTYGNRNAQGLALDPSTGHLWETEHGPRGGDELNLIRKGCNYGWPVVTYGINYSGSPIAENTEAPGMEPPVVQWTPSIAASGLAVYQGDAFPNWRGNLFSGALAHQKIVRLVLDGTKVIDQEILLERQGRIRDVRCFDDGYLTVVFDQPGRVVRLVPE